MEFVTTDAPAREPTAVDDDAATALDSGRDDRLGHVRLRRPPDALRSERPASGRRSAASGPSAVGRCSSSRPRWPTGASTYPPSTAASTRWTPAPARRSGATARRRCGWASPAVQRTARVRHVHRAALDVRRLGARGRRHRRRLRRRQRQGRVAADDGAERVVAARVGRARLRRRLGRRRLGARCAHGPHAVDLPCGRTDQGLARPLRRPGLRRRLRRSPLRARRPNRPARLARLRAAPSGRSRRLLLDAGGRLWARLHRQHGREGLRIRCGQWAAALVAEHRRLRLRITCRSGAA